MYADQLFCNYSINAIDLFEKCWIIELSFFVYLNFLPSLCTLSYSVYKSMILFINHQLICMVITFVWISSVGKFMQLWGKIWSQCSKMILLKDVLMFSRILWLGQMIMLIEAPTINISSISWRLLRCLRWQMLRFPCLISSFCPFWMCLLQLGRINCLVRHIYVYRVYCFKFSSIYYIYAFMRMIYYADVIGHVAERDVLKETEKDGKKSKVLDLTLEDLE